MRLEHTYARRRVKLRTLLQTGVRAYEAIVDSARKLKVDLVVMATHGRTGLTHLLMGSVTEHVVRRAACPVLTLRSAKPSRRKATRKKSKRAA